MVNKGLARTTDTPALSDPGQGTALTSLTFETKGYTHSDLPTAFRKGAAKETAVALRVKKKAAAREKAPTASTALALHKPSKVLAPMRKRDAANIKPAVVASGARQLPKARVINGRTVQRRIGWQATPDSIVITTADRAITQGEDKKWRPAGAWEIEHRATYACRNGAAAKRVATFTDAPSTAQEDAGASSTSNSGTGSGRRPENDHFPEGDFALSPLPRPVRASVIARVPAPEVFDGTILQFSDDKRIEVNVIRMADNVAVVVKGTRANDSQTWDVAQATYDLAPPETEQA